MHTFAHVEFPTLDSAKAAKFYGDLFGWKMDRMEGMDYLVFGTAEGQMIGGISRVEKIPDNKAYANYVEVADIDAMLKKAVSLGGTIVMPKTPLPPPHGFMGQFLSPDGYAVGLWSKE